MLDDALTDAAAKVVARRYFDANGVGPQDVDIDSFEFVYDETNETYRLTVIGRIKTTVLGIMGQDYMPVNIVAEAKVAPPRTLEVVLVLDNTDSMAGQKIDDLRAAANELVDAIMSNSSNEVLVGLVPFATHVRVGMSREYEPWLDVPADDSYERTECEVDEAAATSAGCTEQDAICYDDGVAYSCTEWICPNEDPAPEVCTVYDQPTEWLGCVGSRDYPMNIRDEDLLTLRVPGVLNHAATSGDCAAEILPMTTNKLDVLSAISAMNADGETYIPGGLTWGLRLISNTEPFTEGASYADISAANGIKAIVLMTDGENTKSPNPWDGAHYSSDDTLADDYTIEMCDEIKGKGITLYTIAFEITNADTLSMVQDCATNAGAYFNASNASELSDAFDTIGKSLTELALTK